MRTLRSVSMTTAAVAAFAAVPLATAAAQQPSSSAASPAIGTPRMSLVGIPAVQLNYRGRRLATIMRQGGKAILTVENVDGSGAEPVAIPDGCEPTAIRWARRWNLLAVLTRCAPDAAHPRPTGAAWVLDVQAGKPLRELVNFDGTGSEIQWRSDGKVVAFLFTPSAPAGSDRRYTSVIVAGPVDGGKFGSVSPAGLDVHEFYLSAFGNGLAFTATQAAAPGLPPALYRVAGANAELLFDPATAKGALHGLRIGRLRWSLAGGQPMPLFFLAGSASAAEPEADLYMKLASDTSPITNLTAAQPDKPGWFEPSGTSAVATRVVDGSTELIGYTAFPNGAGLKHSSWLCTIPGTITDGSGPGSMATNGGRYAYFEYPKSGGPLTLNVGSWRVGMACRPRWSRPMGGSAGKAMASD